MTLRVKALVCVVVAGGFASFWSTLGHPAQQWLHFSVYLAAVLLSSGMKVAMPKTDGTMSVNFPFILLGILQLSPLQAVALAACSALALCNFRVVKPFTLVQIAFNVANVTTATVLAWYSYAWLIRHHCEVAPALAFAATIYFLANTIPVASIIAWTVGVSPFKQWYGHFPWYLPFYLVGAMLASAADLISVSFGWLTSLLMIPLVYTIYRAYAAQMATVRAREQQAIETEELQLRTIEGLAMAIEAKDKNTHAHLLRVRVYVSEIGKMMGLDEGLMKALVTASFLHDIGKLAVPEYILNKPGKLTREEFDRMKIHPSVGADILERVRFPYPVVPIVRSHHEAWDGSGYPDGLKGEEIPIGARILTVVDCFDAMASERPYRRALPLKDAIDHVKRGAGTQFDPRIVDLLASCYEQLEEKARQQISHVKPLDTDLLIHRGAAPGAGFEPEHEAPDPNERSDMGALAPSADSRHASLHLIASADQVEDFSGLEQLFASCASPREASGVAFVTLQSLIPFDCFATYLKSGDSLVTQFIDGEYSRAFSAQVMPIGEGLSGWVAQSGRPLLNGNPTVEPTYIEETGLLPQSGSALAVPLFDPNENLFGVLTLYSHASAAFSNNHLRTLQLIEPAFSLALATPPLPAKKDELSSVLISSATA